MLQRTRAQLVAASRALWCTFQPNLTSLTNQRNKNEHYTKFGAEGSPPRGVPRIPRLSVRPISVLHETPHVMVAGRNYCNGFSCNQFLLINKTNKHCILVDAADDWPDDWATFIKASNLIPTHIFLTHCHVDNIINLNAFLVILEQHFGRRLGLMWCSAEQPWVDAFPRACERYGRLEEMRLTLPMMHNSQYTYYTYAHQLHQRQREAQLRHAEETAASRNTDSDHDYDEDGAETRSAPPPPQLVRQRDILLSTATNRSTSFYEFGPHQTLHYLFTPGHSPGHMMLHLPTEKLLFTGDVLFYDKVGRVDLPWATGERLAESLLSLEDYPDNTVLLPGHGRLSTLGRERRENRALRSLYERRQIGQQEVSVGFNEGYL